MLRNWAAYRIVDELYRSTLHVIYRAERHSDGAAVLIKTPSTEHPEPRDIARLRHEQALLARLHDVGHAPASSIEVHGGRIGLVYEERPGIPIHAVLRHGPFPVGTFLDLAIAICGELAVVHDQDIVHRDLSPANILVDVQQGTARIIDFGLATIFDRDAQADDAEGRLEGTARYMSPEQTGRMNRSVDQRTDFYSLGATFFEMLAGRPPFHSDDLLELLHMHIAVEPPRLHVLRPAVPRALAAIVDRLLAKMAEDRYQSARGLLADLQRCRDALAQTGSIPDDLELGTDDRSDRFQIPEKLYGRDTELDQLLHAFESTVGGPAGLVFVAGYSGIGKTSLVAEVHKPIVRNHGYFIRGKADQYRRNEPYSGFIQAFEGLVSQILAEDAARMEQWKQRLQAAVGSLGQLIVDVIPQVELVIGPQPAVEPLLAAEANNRFNRVFEDFVTACAGRDHPLVVFLDDLQWADPASLDLIQVLLRGRDTGNLLLIGAYRDNEVGPSHPLALTIQGLEDAGRRVEHIELGPLERPAVEQLLADTLRVGPTQTTALARLLHTKVAGNPFFLRQLLVRLHRDGLIALQDDGRWSWQQAEIERASVADNVAELVASSIAALPPATQRVLQRASCLASVFDVQRLVRIWGDDGAAVVRDLLAAVVIEVIEPVTSDAGYLLDERSTVGGMADWMDLRFAFVHDQVRAAAYAAMTEAERQQAHLTIGRALLRDRDPERREDLFAIVDHLNRGRAGITDPAERLVLAELDLEAAARARGSNAFVDAARFTASGIELLGEAAWDTNEDLAYRLHLEGVRCHYLAGRFEQADALDRTLRARVADPARRVEMNLAMIPLFINIGNTSAALDRVFEGLEALGRTMSREPDQAAIGQSFGALVGLLGDREIASLIDLPVAEDPARQAEMFLLYLGAVCAYMGGHPNLWSTMLLALTRASLEHGNTVFSTYGYTCMGMFVGPGLGQYERACDWGDLGCALAERLDVTAFMAAAHMLFGCYISFWRDHIDHSLEMARRSYGECIASGNLLFGAYDFLVLGMHTYWRGSSLDDVVEQLEPCEDFVRSIHYTDMLQMFTLLRRTTAALTGETEGPASFSDDGFDEQAHHAELMACDFHVPKHLWYALKTQLRYLAGDYEAARAGIEVGDQLTPVAFGLYQVTEYELYCGLTMAASVPQLQGEERAQALQRLDGTLVLFSKLAEAAPSNFGHKHLLLLAEKARVDGRESDAITAYERAAEQALEQRYVQIAAVAKERAGSFHIELGRRSAARGYLSDARALYRQWGATAHADALGDRYGVAFQEPTRSYGVTVSVSSDDVSDTVDLETLLKSFAALTSAVDLESLLPALMKLAMENAGADRGVLLVRTEIGLRVRGRSTVTQGYTAVDVPFDSSDDVARSVIDYAVRTGGSVLLSDARADDRFLRDTYFAREQPLSLVCLPFHHQGRLAGVVYLENHLTVDAFTQDRLALLQVLSTQIAVVLDNAKLFSRLERAHRRQVELSESQSQFVPYQFLETLGKDITQVRKGQHVARRMSVLFSDLRGFTPMTERLGAHEVVDILNRYFAYMEPAITENGGFIDAFVGDAIMALFDHADQAVRAGIAMQAALVEFNATVVEGGVPLKMGVGVNTGDLLLGIVGGLNRLKCGVVGDCVNLASRVESLTKTYGAPLLISPETHADLADPEAFSMRAIDRVVVKGRLEPITIYEVLDAELEDRRARKAALAGAFDSHLQRFYARDFEAARLGFLDLTTEDPLDDVPRLYVERCDHYLVHPPPEAWDGAIRMTHK